RSTASATACAAACSPTASTSAITRCRCRSGAGWRRATSHGSQRYSVTSSAGGRLVVDAGRCYALFRVAAGPRLGFGHLRRATVLAGALDEPCALSVRGAATLRRPWRQAPPGPDAALQTLRPRLLVIDDP